MFQTLYHNDESVSVDYLWRICRLSVEYLSSICRLSVDYLSNASMRSTYLFSNSRTLHFQIVKNGPGFGEGSRPRPKLPNRLGSREGWQPRPKLPNRPGHPAGRQDSDFADAIARTQIKAEAIQRSKAFRHKVRWLVKTWVHPVIITEVFTGRELHYFHGFEVTWELVNCWWCVRQSLSSCKLTWSADPTSSEYFEHHCKILAHKGFRTLFEFRIASFCGQNLWGSLLFSIENYRDRVAFQQGYTHPKLPSKAVWLKYLDL